MKLINIIKNHKILFTNIFLFLIFFIINMNVKVQGADDINIYIYNGSLLPLRDIINHCLERANTLNAKTVEMIYCFLGCFPLIIFKILNSLMTVLFFNIILKFIFGNKLKDNKNTHLLLLLEACIVFVTFSIIYQNFFWMAGSINHMWSIVMILVIAYPFRLLLDNINYFEKRKVLPILFFILCLLNGNGLENTIPLLLIYMVITTLIYLKKNKKIPKFTWISMLCVLAGFLFILSYPSTLARAEMTYLGAKDNLFEKFVSQNQLLLIVTIISIIIYSLIKIYKRIRNSEKIKDFDIIYLQTVGLWLLSFISLFLLTFAHYFVNRSVLIIRVSMLSIILLTIYYLLDLIKSKLLNIIILIIMITTLVYQSTKWINFFQDYNNFKEVYEPVIEENIDTIIKENKIQCIVPSVLVNDDLNALTICNSVYLHFRFKTSPDIMVYPIYTNYFDIEDIPFLSEF